MLPDSVGGLLGSVGGVVHGDPGGGDSGQGEGEKSGDDRMPPARGPVVSAVTGVEEVTLGLAERRVAGGIGADPRGGIEQAAAVQIGRVPGAACPFGGHVVQPGADDPVGVGFGQPRITQQRPRGQ